MHLYPLVYKCYKHLFLVLSFVLWYITFFEIFINALIHERMHMCAHAPSAHVCNTCCECACVQHVLWVRTAHVCNTCSECACVYASECIDCLNACMHTYTCIHAHICVYCTRTCHHILTLTSVCATERSSVKLIAFELAGEDRERRENPVVSRLKIAFYALHKRGWTGFSLRLENFAANSNAISFIWMYLCGLWRMSHILHTYQCNDSLDISM